MYWLKKLNVYCGVCLVLIVFVTCADTKSLPSFKHLFANKTSPRNIQLTGVQQLQILRHLIKDCENSSSNTTIAKTSWQCLKVTSLYLLDDVISRDIVPVWKGVRFVRMQQPYRNNHSSYINESQESDLWKRKDLQYLTWFDRLALSFTRLLWTHKLEINLKQLTDAYIAMGGYRDTFSNSNSSDPVGTARHRHQRYNMMLTMMFGVTAFGAVLVPMGFQFLSIVSGKALLLAKMALLLASINGLKRVANSGLHYGLYHVPGEHYGGIYDRGDLHHPRNVQGVLGVAGQRPHEVGLSVK
ncbi:uncharacterized protein LOC106088483 [Stomoxys calcitrans]|uniref:uncharacterized protein LOC106088483 n=1 Tax=Stomoxys calcitrans TaxID=35570 RepID=UPI0027E2263A|nr:uncharacterized protein LOC106088483 [Stomoxys calcitrans]